MNTIDQTIDAYEGNLTIAQQAAREGWSVSRPDALVRFDDAPDALGILQAEWRALQDSSTARMMASVSEGHRLIWIGYWSLFGLV